MPESRRAPSVAEPALVCGNCRQPMRRLALAGHYGRVVEIDICSACHLVWFDLTETARLTGPALLELVGEMATAQSLPHESLRKDARCARCSGTLKTVHNRSRWGASLQLECLARHGAYQSFAQFLQEKGLLRPMSRVDRARLLEQVGGIDCVNCGAAIGAHDECCSYCQSVASVLDVARLAQALDPEGAITPHAVHLTRTEQAAMQCGACGAALPPGQMLTCAQCGATLAINRLADAHEKVNALAPALRAHALKPAPAIVKRRLDALGADMPRRRDWARGMEAEARQQSGNAYDETDWRSLFSAETNPLRAVLLALVIWFVWWYW
jgi:Zn-finger nucleic acid-binding protein/predicted nucleic acid-binding Zn ribbon protein